MLQNGKTHEEKESIKERYLKNNPRYEELKEQINLLFNNIYKIENKIKKRERVRKKLLSYKTLILRYTK